RRNAVMPAEREPAHLAPAGVETRPAPHPRLLPIGPDNPPAAHLLAIDRDAIGRGPAHPRAPAHHHTRLFGVANQQFVKAGAVYAQSASRGEARVDRRSGSDEPDPPKRKRTLRADADAERAQRLQRIRHEALTARL